MTETESRIDILEARSNSMHFSCDADKFPLERKAEKAPGANKGSGSSHRGGGQKSLGSGCSSLLLLPSCAGEEVDSGHRGSGGGIWRT